MTHDPRSMNAAESPPPVVPREPTTARDPLSHEDRPAPEAHAPEVLAQRDRPIEVLVVEDDPATRPMLARAVRSFGYSCREASDGLEALEMHRAARADIILADWRMPRMDGFELCRRTRSESAGGTYTYFLLMSSFGDKSRFLEGMDAGADDYQQKPLDLDELRARLASAARVVRLNRTLEEKNSMLRRDSQTFFRTARIDPLTGISNRLRLKEDLDALESRARRYGHRYCAALCDVDHFKRHNDRFGHLAGDAALREVALTIRSQLRSGDAVYRYGGEEFLVLLPEQTLAEAARALERIRGRVEALAIPTVNHRVLTISAGVAELHAKSDPSLDTWIERADRALYRAKARGRNRVEIEARPEVTDSTPPEATR